MKYRVKKRWSLAGSLIVAGFGLIIFWNCFIKIDPVGYQKIMERANPTLQSEAGNPYRASQRRKGVQKNFLQAKGDFRLASQLNCDSSDLVFEQDGESQAVIEYMRGVVCLVQEELFYLDASGNKSFDAKESETFGQAMQTIRVIKADLAKYHYATETLEASLVNMALYTIPGHLLPESFTLYKPSVESTAVSLNIAIIDKEMRFQAENFKGTLL